VVLTRRRIAAIVSGLLLGVPALAVGAGAAAADDGTDPVADVAAAPADPLGNNGTIKVDGEVFDDLPNNEPHVGCTFQVDFYGFDEGDLNADVSFDLQPPTLREGDDQNLLTDVVFIGEDDNSGGGSEAGLDASQTYVLDFTGVTPHPIQGFHVKLTIHADGSQGADTKYKVFWVTPCVETPPPTTSSAPPTTSSAPPTTTPGEVGGTTPAGGLTLPKTGAGFPIGSAAVLAVLLMAIGGVVLLASRGVIKLPPDGVIRLPRGVTIRLPYRHRH
jgi:hypothetical protein